MKILRYVPTMLWVGVAVACFQLSVLGQTAQSNREPAAISASASSVRWQATGRYSVVTMTVSAPDGQVYSKEFRDGASPEFMLSDKQGNRLPDGQYTYELRFTSPQARNLKDRIAPAPDDGNGIEDEQGRTNRKRVLVDSVVQAGGFAVLNGVVYVGNETEPTNRRPDSSARNINKDALPRSSGVLSGNTVTRLRNHRLSLIAMPDQVIPDDVIVQGSACVGLDCVNNENFGFDTIRVKENNTRIQFDDTSTAAGFPTNNWQIRANASGSGGASFLGFVDQGSTGNSETGTIVFEVDAGAPANSLRVSSAGKIGLRTATPVLDVHANTSNTPAIRLEQNNSGGFTAQTWDIGANEANFFVRDTTGGSLLPFRIRPGAPTSSIDISASGNVGIGNASPSATVDARIPFSKTDTTIRPSLFVLSNDGAGLLVQLKGGASQANRLVTVETGDFGVQNAGTLGLQVNGGNVGIGTSAPDQLLSVNGDASKAGGGTWQTFSDERLKNIKGHFNSGLSAVMRLQPLRYEYRKDNALGLKSVGEHIGFTAQAVQKLIPEAVTKSQSGYLMVNSDPILWTMLNAIKEQQKEIAELKGQIRKLQMTTRNRRK